MRSDDHKARITFNKAEKEEKSISPAAYLQHLED